MTQPNSGPANIKRVAVVGARGHVGVELLKLLLGHPYLQLGYLGSRSWQGQTLLQALPQLSPYAPLKAGGSSTDVSQLRFSAPSPANVATANCDAVVLALPNALSSPYVAALNEKGNTSCIVDLSADHRFDSDWTYGLVERQRQTLRQATHIANPGCYATAAQLAIAPLKKWLAQPPRIFGVSGYSGAGTTPNPRNDPEQLHNNLMPYALVDHTHEREIARHLDHPVHFMPHVAAFFRGISLTIDLALTEAINVTRLNEALARAYTDEPLICLSEKAPLVRDAVGGHQVNLGGLRSHGSRAVLVATIDNLLKGAATQCLQNLNLALGFNELTGIPLNGA